MWGTGLTEGIEWAFWMAAIVWWVVELDLSPIELVLMGTVLEACVLLFETPTGVVADLQSRRRSLVIAQVIMAIAFVWAVASHNFWVILPAQALFGIGWTFRSGADVAWVTDELKGRGLAAEDEIDLILLERHKVGIASGVVFVALAALFGTLVGVRWVIVGCGLLYLLVGVCIARVFPEDYFVPGSERGEGFFDILRTGFRVMRTRPRLRVLIGVVLFLNFGAEAFDRLGPAHFLREIGFGEDSLLALAALFIAVAIASLAVNWWSTRQLLAGKGVARLAGALLFFTVVGATFVLLNVGVAIALGFMLQDSMRESLYPVLDGWANRDAPSEVRATIHSLVGQMTAIGELIGGLALGALAQLVSIRASLAGAALMFLVAGLLTVRGRVEVPETSNV
ncbi:MAG: MFS transporter [Acidimicrobiales bacterium]|nr:MFS transporter [Acidimicrobiales bacterium]RZV48385.1 MAG: MFS transporter [Acidimicrobiales bacterium]